jgi:hypothetical protein
VSFEYTLPSQSTISRPLLDLSYETIKNQLVLLLSASPSFGLVIDESTNISLNRIINQRGPKYHDSVSISGIAEIKRF